MTLNLFRCLAAIAAGCCLQSAQAASDYVLIDRGEPAYTVYAGLSTEQAEKARAKIGNAPAQLVPVNEFSDARDKFIGERIVIDEYANARTVEGIVALVRKYPGTPFGITWNGGIAFTRNDYEYAKRQWALYSKRPDEYKQSRTGNPAADPVNPKGHLGPLLGW